MLDITITETRDFVKKLLMENTFDHFLAMVASHTALTEELTRISMIKKNLMQWHPHHIRPGKISGLMYTM